MDTTALAAENLTNRRKERISAGINVRDPHDVARAVLRGIERRR